MLSRSRDQLCWYLEEGDQFRRSGRAAGDRDPGKGGGSAKTDSDRKPRPKYCILICDRVRRRLLGCYVAYLPVQSRGIGIVISPVVIRVDVGSIFLCLS